MLTAPPDHFGAGLSGPAGSSLDGGPWSMRIADASSLCSAVELYEADSLLDVVSDTAIAAVLLRGARASGSDAAYPRALAWGRLPLTGAGPEVTFSRGGFCRAARVAPVVTITTWCWAAVADGRFDAVTVYSPTASIRRRLSRGQPWC
jgi:hypothetical protein